MSENYHRSGTPSVLPIVYCNHSLKPIKGGGAADINFTPLQHPDHAVKVRGINWQVAPTIRSMDEQFQVEHFRYNPDDAKMQAMCRV